jgi:hypothetical protein
MRSSLYKFILAAAFIVTTAVYWPGLSGSYLFDDYPNIVDNHDVQPHAANLPSLVRVALSSPSSEFKRPLASLSFAANYLATGLDPYWMKLTNLVIHLLNGLLVFLLARLLLQSVPRELALVARAASVAKASPLTAAEASPTFGRASIVAALIATGWMLLPINLTAVLYVVQRMESMANLFVLLGLIGYVAGRRCMLTHSFTSTAINTPARRRVPGWSHVSPQTLGFITCLISITVPTALGTLAKETAVMLPLYALLIEWMLFRFRSSQPCSSPGGQIGACPTAVLLGQTGRTEKNDRRVITLFLVVLILPLAMGLAWLLPSLLKPESWATRDFTLGTRLLSEARIFVDYIAWTLMPTPNALSFYHDDFRISTGLLAPWTTLASIMFLAALIALMLWLRQRRPLMALGIALFLGCQLLTGTILPLELIYEHRNYFASFGLLLAIVPMLAAPSHSSAPPMPVLAAGATSITNGANYTDKSIATEVILTGELGEALPLALPRHVLLGGLMLCWMALTAFTAYAWGNPLRLAEDLAARAPKSPRAQYELGRTYIIYSGYDPSSPFTRLAYAPLEKAASLTGSSILPQQALIFMNSRMHLPLKNAWWDSMIAKLLRRPPTVQDESSLASLNQCIRDQQCDLPKNRMVSVYSAALSHPNPTARLLAMYGDYAWNVLNDHLLGERMTANAVTASPSEPAYRITLVRMLIVQGRTQEAQEALLQLQHLNYGGRLDHTLEELRALFSPPTATAS